MPEMTIGVIIFSSFFALSLSGAVMWSLERKAKASRRQIVSFSRSFLAGCVTFSVVYVLNRLIFPGWPKAAAFFNLAILAAIFAFRVVRKKLRYYYYRYRRRRPKTGKNHHLRAEAAALERMLEKDPLNAFCLEKLSELYEEMGEYDRALDAAHEAVKLDPSMKNKWRVEDLKEIHGKNRHKDGRKLF